MDDRDEAKQDETIPGGAYITDATLRGGKHYGGKVINCDGETLREFEPNQENTGLPLSTAERAAKDQEAADSQKAAIDRRVADKKALDEAAAKKTPAK